MLTVLECSRKKQPENPDGTILSLDIPVPCELGLGLWSGMPLLS